MKKPKGSSEKKFGWQWPDGVKFEYEPSLPISQGQWDAIANSLGVEPDSHHVQAAYDAVRRHVARETVMADLPAGDHRRRDIETLMALSRAIEGINLNVRAALARQGIESDWVQSLVPQDPEHTALSIRHAAFELMFLQGPPKRGRPTTKELRDILLLELAEIYTAVTGAEGFSNTGTNDRRGPNRPTGPCLRFLRAAVALVPGLTADSDGALVQATKRKKRIKGYGHK